MTSAKMYTLSKQERHYLRYLIKQDIKKRERGLEKVEPHPGQQPEEFAAFRQHIEDKLVLMRALHDKFQEGNETSQD